MFTSSINTFTEINNLSTEIIAKATDSMKLASSVRQQQKKKVEAEETRKKKK